MGSRPSALRRLVTQKRFWMLPLRESDGAGALALLLAFPIERSIDPGALTSTTHSCATPGPMTSDRRGSIDCLTMGWRGSALAQDGGVRAPRIPGIASSARIVRAATVGHINPRGAVLVARGTADSRSMAARRPAATVGASLASRRV